MEVKEAVDVLGLVLGTVGREPSPEEIRKAGSAILDLVEPGFEREMESSKVKYELEVEIKRALGYLKRNKNRLEGEALIAALDLEKELRARLGERPPRFEGNAIEIKHEVKVDLLGGDEDIHLQLKRKRLNLGLRQKDLAEELGISCAYLSLIERGKVTRTSRKVRERISAFLEEGLGPGKEGSAAGTGAMGTAGGKEKPPPQLKPEEQGKKGGEMENKWEALKRLLEAALILEGRELEILAAVAESWARKCKA